MENGQHVPITPLLFWLILCPHSCIQWSPLLSKHLQLIVAGTLHGGFSPLWYPHLRLKLTVPHILSSTTSSGYQTPYSLFKPYLHCLEIPSRWFPGAVKEVLYVFSDSQQSLSFVLTIQFLGYHNIMYVCFPRNRKSDPCYSNLVRSKSVTLPLTITNRIQHTVHHTTKEISLKAD